MGGDSVVVSVDDVILPEGVEFPDFVQEIQFVPMGSALVVTPTGESWKKWRDWLREQEEETR